MALRHFFSSRLSLRHPNHEFSKSMPHQTDQQRQPPTCRFFATQAGCRAGADCRFAHIAPVSNDKSTENHALSSPLSLNPGKAPVSTEAAASASAGVPSRSLEGTNAVGEHQAATQPSRHKKGPRRAERNDHDNSFNSKLDLQPFDMNEPASQAQRGGRRGGHGNSNLKSSPSNRQGNQEGSNSRHSPSQPQHVQRLCFLSFPLKKLCDSDQSIWFFLD